MAFVWESGMVPQSIVQMKTSHGVLMRRNGRRTIVWDGISAKWVTSGGPKHSLEALSAYLGDFEGTPVAESEPIRMGFYRTVGVHDSFVFTTNLWFCQMDTPPKERDSSMSPCRQYIRRVLLTWTGVAELCELETDLSRIPKELFEKKRNSKGQQFYHVSYDLVLTPTSASLLFDLQFNGVSYGSVRSRYWILLRRTRKSKFWDG